MPPGPHAMAQRPIAVSKTANSVAVIGTSESYHRRFPSASRALRSNRARRSRNVARVTVASLFGRTYIFVMLERIGGVVVYEAGRIRRRRQGLAVRLTSSNQPDTSVTRPASAATPSSPLGNITKRLPSALTS